MKEGPLLRLMAQRKTNEREEENLSASVAAHAPINALIYGLLCRLVQGFFFARDCLGIQIQIGQLAGFVFHDALNSNPPSFAKWHQVYAIIFRPVNEVGSYIPVNEIGILPTRLDVSSNNSKTDRCIKYLSSL